MAQMQAKALTLLGPLDVLEQCCPLVGDAIGRRDGIRHDDKRDGAEQIVRTIVPVVLSRLLLA
jgi:hypothetical protein